MSESIHDPLRIRLSGPEAVHEAILEVRNFAGIAKLNEADAARLAIIVEELVTNLYDHGGLGADDVFELQLSAMGTNVRLALIDPGKAFDPHLAPLDSASPVRGGGAGLKLVQAWTTNADYRSSDGHNTLVLLLPMQAPRSSSS